MTAREKIIREAQTGKTLRANELAKKHQISRQTASRVLGVLVQEGLLLRQGSTRGATYQLAKKAKKRLGKQKLRLIKKLHGLSEQSVWTEVQARLPLRKSLNHNARSILAYAFTEILNNAIDHSQSEKVDIVVELEANKSSFTIRDFGIGLFQNIREKFKLNDEYGALEHVLKGKQTTIPEAHSGEGLFFTSRISDVFVIRSHKLRVTIDNQIPDSFVAEERFLNGTDVGFEIKCHTKKKLEQVFSEFANEDFEFDKSTVRVRISAYSGALSRSQARRILFGLEKYKRLVFDFKGVNEIGQAFADEVFRVFALRHSPIIVVDYQNAVSPVEFMIERAKRGG